MPTRRSDVLEIIAERSLVFGLSGLVAVAVAGVLYKFRGDGILLGLIWVLALAGAAAVFMSIYSAFQVRKVTDYAVDCPYCSKRNHLTLKPTEDFTCAYCQRLVPVVDGEILPVFQVRCGFCNV